MFYKLPRGAKKMSPITCCFGNWVEMEFDAMIEQHGISWYRVKDGMGGHGDREDWVADFPNVCLSVHDYQYRKPFWGIEKYRSMNEAMRGQMAVSMRRLKSDYERHETMAVACKTSHDLLSQLVKASNKGIARLRRRLRGRAGLLRPPHKAS